MREDALSLAKEGPACEGGTHLWEDTLSLVVRGTPFAGGCLIACGKEGPIYGRMPYRLRRGTPLAKKSKKEKETKNESSI